MQMSPVKICKLVSDDICMFIHASARAPDSGTPWPHELDNRRRIFLHNILKHTVPPCCQTEKTTCLQKTGRLAKCLLDTGWKIIFFHDISDYLTSKIPYTSAGPLENDCKCSNFLLPWRDQFQLEPSYFL